MTIYCNFCINNLICLYRFLVGFKRQTPHTNYLLHSKINYYWDVTCIFGSIHIWLNRALAK